MCPALLIYFLSRCFELKPVLQKQESQHSETVDQIITRQHEPNETDPTKF